MTYFRLGFVGNDPYPGHEFKEGRLSIPYITPSGIVQMRFRAIPEDGVLGNPEKSPKMLSLANAGTNLYNAQDLLIDTDILAICEGEPDTWTVHMLEIPVVGIAGVEAWDKIKDVARAFRFRKVVIVADNDDGGEGLKFAEKLQMSIRQARIALMPTEHDANSFAQTSGLNALAEKLGI